MRNIFENAKLGDKFVTKNGTVVTFKCYNHPTDSSYAVYVIPVTCMVDGCNIYYNMDGVAKNAGDYLFCERTINNRPDVRELDIVSKQGSAPEPVNHKQYWNTVDSCRDYIIDQLPGYLADRYCLDEDDVRQTLIEFYKE